MATIKKFVEEYTQKTKQLREQYLRDNLKITKYIPFVKKDMLAQNLVNVSTYKYEDYKNEDGAVELRKTDIIKVNSIVQYLLFCRVIIENYTNLEVETDGFFEEYDVLKQSGLLNELMIGDEDTPPLIPMEEISELRTIVDMKQRDIMTNYATPQSYISGQLERFGTLLSITLKPVLEKISSQLENMDEKDIEKFTKIAEKAFKRIK